MGWADLEGLGSERERVKRYYEHVFTKSELALGVSDTIGGLGSAGAMASHSHGGCNGPTGEPLSGSAVLDR